MTVQKKDTIVIGSGPAGYVCAIRLAQLGKQVTLIEKDAIGGVCLNRGCIPSKALITASSFYEKLGHSGAMGIEVSSIKLNFKKMMSWKDGVVQQLTQGVGALLKANKVEIISGNARFTKVNQIEVTQNANQHHLEFNHCVIATGSRPISIASIPIDHESIFDSTGILSLEKQPESLVCIGGGYIGLELGIFYSKIGTKVTIIEGSTQLLSGTDPDILNVLMKRLKALKIQVLLNTTVDSVEKKSNQTILLLKSGGQTKTLTADKILVTVGRKPNIENMGLENAKVNIKNGFIDVNNQCQTSQAGIYAIGDVVGQPLLAHKGSAEGMVAAEAIAGLKTVWDHYVIPAVIFTDPEIASAGLSETEAKAKGLHVDIATFPFAANGRALSLNETEGFVKIISQTGKILGVHIIGPEASQLISEAALAIEMGAHVNDLALTIHPHPTLSETIMEAAHVALGHGIHIFKPKKA